MNRKWSEVLALLFVGVASTMMAFAVTSPFVRVAESQEAQLPPPVPPPPPGTEVTPETMPGDNAGAAPVPPPSPAANELPFLEPYNYNPEGRRDPFEPFTTIQVTVGVDGPAAGPMLPLQQFDLGQIKLIGIMWDVKDPKAMFLDPNNEVHTLRKNDRLGRSNGYIAVIREGEVVIVETARIRGELLYTTRVVKMARN
ncbi:MAG: pilus assembly protein PilP [Bdellovibrionales bacterium]|nr:pilus assembly protein PilP [Bdellovibrionales bacterium]